MQQGEDQRSPLADLTSFTGHGDDAADESTFTISRNTFELMELAGIIQQLLDDLAPAHLMQELALETPDFCMVELPIG